MTAGGEHRGVDGRVVLVSGDDNPLRSTLCEGLSEAGAVAELVPGISTLSEASRLIADARERLGRIDALVACPRQPPAASLEELDPESFAAAIDSAYKAPFLYTQAVLPDLREHGQGRLLYVTSAAGILGRAYTAHVAAAARALVATMRTVALEEAPRVTANAIAVGPMEGDPLLAARVRAMTETGGAGDGAAALEAVMDRIPLGRLTEPPEVVETVLWALRPESDFLTGQVIPVAGASELQVWP